MARPRMEVYDADAVDEWFTALEDRIRQLERDVDDLRDQLTSVNENME